ncbi:hypothetical protein [Chamaesiphon minutus]|uniref:Spore coat protein U domain-containing protein n=1 Tax=Chamaesiphon minutus (strain ATCC 27169 / PCC 6605) TaxID=1173020 RepID=K9UAN8_CHAP6|nr:hypothetical protein [Chamaesiphon minutus]AFY91900.1 hypothetical protein Cha6605_0623 [Chamaesiphon minutus PCC 6605]
MRPAKLLTLSAVVGLTTICYGNVAQAAPTPVNFSGSVAASCTIDSVTDGSLSEELSNFPAIALVATGGDRGIVQVKCNTATGVLTLAINSGSTKVYNGTAKIRFNGGGGVFGTANLPATVPSINPIVVSLPTVTNASGDIGRIQVRVDAPLGKLLKTANDYLVVVDATIVP